MGEREKGLFLEAGMVVEAEAGRSEVEPQAEVPLVVLAEGAGWVVVDKPAGVAVHPLEAGERGTVLNAVAARYPQVQGVGEGGLRSGVVHRLDVDTSGVLAFATMQSTWEVMRRAFAGHEAKKVYRAIVRGRLEGTRREVMDLVVARHHPARVRVVPLGELPKPAGTRRCELSWRAVEGFGDRATLVEVSLGTGFLHQIRVMMAERGHLVLGDGVYGDRSADPVAVGRQMLHASYLRAGPAEGRSAEPADMEEAIGWLRAAEG